MKTAVQLIKEKYGYKSVRVLNYDEAIEFATEYARQVAEAVRDECCTWHLPNVTIRRDVNEIDLTHFIK